MRKSFGWLLVVPAVSLSCSAPAEETQPQASGDVPHELVLALVGGQVQDAQVFVGSAPSAVTSVVPILSDAQVAGGLIRSSGGTVLLNVAEPLETALDQYGDFLETRGWERMPEDPRGPGGFEMSPRPITATWCTESHWMTLSGLSVAANDYLRVRHNSMDAGASPCLTPQARAQWAMFNYGLHFPSLAAPPGSEVRGGGSSGSTGSVDRDVLVVTDLSAEELFEHYAEQLTRAGWEPAPQTSDEGVAIGRWAATDDQGDPAIGVLAVWALPPADNYRAWIRLERVTN